MRSTRKYYKKLNQEHEHHKKVVSYFKRSKLGYDIVLGGVKHFGFYPKGKKDISEKRAQELMQDLLASNLNLKKKHLVLDAGCGQGVVSTYLARKYGCKIVGITIVPFEVKKANALAKKVRVRGNVEYHVMDYTHTTFADNQFDAIYTMESFVHSPNTKGTLEEFFRILKPGGRLAMFEYTMAKDDAFTTWEKKMLDIVIEVGAMGSLKNMRNDVFQEIIRKVGFESVKEQNISLNCRPSFERLRTIAILPYFFVKLFHLQKYFINVTAAIELYEPAKKDLIRYCIFTSRKPRDKRVNQNM